MIKPKFGAVAFYIGICLTALLMLSCFARQEKQPDLDKIFDSELSRMKTQGYDFLEKIVSSLDNQHQYVVALYHQHQTEFFIPPHRLMIYLVGQEKVDSLFCLEQLRISFHSLNNQDINQDGYKELVLGLWQGGNCSACSWIEIYQVRGRKVRLLNVDKKSKLGLSLIPKELQDLDYDGQFELVSITNEFEFYHDLCHACSPSVSLISAWSSGKYTEMSEKYPAFYNTEIQDLEGKLEMEKNIQFYIGECISLLLNYLVKGEKEKGWSTFRESMQKSTIEKRQWVDDKAVIDYWKIKCGEIVQDLNQRFLK